MAPYPDVPSKYENGNLCTRFSTELVLRRGPTLPATISITPSSQEIRSEAEVAKLLAFKHELVVSVEKIKLDMVIDSAKKAMGIDDTSKVFSYHVLLIELSGPKHPHLTLVDPFFGVAVSDDGCSKRLRASLQDQLTDFAAIMRENGHTYTVLDEVPKHKLQCITRKDYITKVKEQLKMNKGRELPGMFDPLIIGQIFRDQCKPWDAIIKNTQNKIVGNAEVMWNLALAHCTDRSTFTRLMEEYMQPKFNYLERIMDKKVDEFLEPYNHCVTEEVRKTQAGRRAQELRETLENYFDAARSDTPIKITDLHVDDLVENLVTRTVADMEDYVSSTATDWMLAYYEVDLLMVRIIIYLTTLRYRSRRSSTTSVRMRLRSVFFLRSSQLFPAQKTC